MSLDSVLSGQTVTVPGRHGFAVHPLPPPGSQREQDPVDRCQWEKDGGPPGFASHTPVGQAPPRTSTAPTVLTARTMEPPPHTPAPGKSRPQPLSTRRKSLHFGRKDYKIRRL